MSKPLKLWAHDGGPNPYKVEIILKELGVKYEKVEIEFADMKKPAFEALNPNGRVPALEDPNTGITTWESGCCIQYLIETYDPDHKLSFASAAEKWQANTWLFYQMSGQGPYFGQAVWFQFIHPEKFPSAIERYTNEIRRVTMVLDRELKDKEWLVGGRMSFADLSFTVWHWVIMFAFKDLVAQLESEFPHWKAWSDRMEARPIVAKLHEQRLAATKAMAARMALNVDTLKKD